MNDLMTTSRQLENLSSFSRRNGDYKDNISCDTKVFPMILYKILKDSEATGHAHIISWLPDGKSFKVHNRYAFIQHVWPNYSRSSSSHSSWGTSSTPPSSAAAHGGRRGRKWKSFTRQLNLYNFKRNATGSKFCVDFGAYSHKLFVRDNESLCSRLVRPSLAKNKNKDHSQATRRSIVSTRDRQHKLLNQQPEAENGPRGGESTKESKSSWFRHVDGTYCSGGGDNQNGNLRVDRYQEHELQSMIVENKAILNMLLPEHYGYREGQELYFTTTPNDDSSSALSRKSFRDSIQKLVLLLEPSPLLPYDIGEQEPLETSDDSLLYE